MIICLGPICVPVSLLWPLVLFLVQPLLRLLQAWFPGLQVPAWLERTGKQKQQAQDQAVIAGQQDLATDKQAAAAETTVMEENGDTETDAAQKETSAGEVGEMAEGPTTATAEDGELLVLTDDDDWEVLLSGTPTVVAMFSSTWCQPCKEVKPVFEDLAQSLSRRAAGTQFVYVDIDECGDTAADAGIHILPSFRVYKQKERVDAMAGARVAALTKMVKKHCGPGPTAPVPVEPAA